MHYARHSHVVETLSPFFEYFKPIFFAGAQRGTAWRTQLKGVYSTRAVLHCAELCLYLQCPFFFLFFFSFHFDLHHHHHEAP